MKYRKKYNIDINEVHILNSNGYSIIEISKMFNVPPSTLRRYLNDAGYIIYFNRYRQRLANTSRRKKLLDSDYEYACSYNWKKALIETYGYRCQICGYNKVVDAHHIVPLFSGGKSVIGNGILLCPNHHAEVHAGLVDLMAFLKSGELLGPLAEGNQQPSRTSSLETRGSEGSTTRVRAKAVTTPRAPDTIYGEDIV